MNIVQANNRKNRQYIFIAISIFLACLTPRFIGFLKINIGFNMSIYSIIVILTFLFYAAKGKMILRKQFHVVFIGILLFATIISIVTTIDFIGWLQYLFYIVTCLFLMVQLLQYKSNSIFELIINSIVPAFSIQIIIGLFEVYRGSYLFEVGGFSRRVYGIVPVSGFYNPNDYAMFVSTMLPLVLYALIYINNKMIKVAYGAIVIAAVYLLVKIMSRATVLAMTVSIFVFLMLLLKKKKYKGWVILFFSLLFLSYLLIPPINSWFNTLIIQNSIDTSSTSDYYRINLIKNGLYFLKETNGLGVGAGSLKKWFELRAVFDTGGLLYMHNWYAEILATFGVIIFALYAIFHIKIFLTLYKKIKERGNDFGLTVAFFISFIVFSIASISSSSNIYSEWVWMYIAVMVAYVVYCTKKGDSVMNVVRLDKILSQTGEKL